MRLLKGIGVVLGSLLITGTAAFGDDLPLTDAQASEALRRYVAPMRGNEPAFPQGQAVVKACERAPQVAGYMCVIDWQDGSGRTQRNRLVGFFRDARTGQWDISLW